MNVRELIEELEDYGDHLTIVIKWDEDESETLRVTSGIDADGMAACLIEVDR